MNGRLLTAMTIIVVLNISMIGAGLFFIEQFHLDYRVAALLLPITMLVSFIVLRILKRRLK